MNEFSLAYADDRDKSFGVAGMAIALVACDCQDYIREINLDAPAGHNIVMSHDYGFRGNPRMSAKIVWEQSVKELRVTTTMALGNIACRSRMLRNRSLDKKETQSVRDAVRTDAAECCALDTDEADALFDHCLGYVDGIFSHHAIPPVVNGFVARINEQRSMTIAEIVETLARFGLR